MKVYEQDNTVIIEDIKDFESKQENNIIMTGADGVTGGHGGGDGGIVETLYDYLSDDYSGSSVPSIEESYYNHMLVFAAENARLENRVVDVETFEKSI